MMDSVLKCNNLKCRVLLHETAVVTTCRFVVVRPVLWILLTRYSHIFCTRCAETTGLSSSASARRACSACGATLHNPDDVVLTALSPSEDYKTSLLSGLSPTIIMETASRGLAFFSYQVAQEVVYQEHLAKGLTEKYSTLSQQMDQLIHDGNTQIKALHEKLQGYFPVIQAAVSEIDVIY